MAELINKLKFEGGVPRPNEFTENPFIGKDGKDYHSYNEMKRANVELFRKMFPEKIDIYNLY